jgi:RimJ/RimL family protein N-acetyltransferase
MPFTIPVRISGSVAATLEAIDQRALDDGELLERLTAWRTAARSAFLTQFEATPARTRRWLEQTVLPDAARVLFVIRNHAAGAVGTIGFMNLTANSAELDNLIRGERRGPAALARCAEAALVEWLFESAGVERVEAVVLSTNFSALQLHHSLGFEVMSRTPLRRVEHNGGEVALVDAAEPDEHGLFKLRLAVTREGLVP